MPNNYLDPIEIYNDIQKSAFNRISYHCSDKTSQVAQYLN